MADSNPLAGDSGAQPPLVIQNIPPKPPTRWGRWLVNTILLFSLFANLSLYGLYRQYYPAAANEEFKEGDRYAPDKIAIIKVSGMITRDLIQAPKKELERAAEDEGVKAVILAVNTPGGTISGSDELYHAIDRFKEESGKPVVVSMQGMATSGGYYVSAPADRIFAERTCITGSIGVIMSSFNIEKLATDWGIDPVVIKSGAMKDSGSMFRPMNDEERAYWQNLIDVMFDRFLSVILAHRDEQVGGEEALKKLADGRVYLAEKAKELGLVDEIGYQEDAIAYTKKKLGLGENVRIVTYRRPIDGLLGLIQGKGESDATLKVDWLEELQVPRMYLLPAPMVGVGR